MESNPVLEARATRKFYGGVHAVDGCSLTLQQGALTGLIGPNGAGKSTMVGLLSGAERPDSGEILLNGTDVTGLSASRRARLGIVRTFQVSRALGHMTVLDNMMIAPCPQVGESVVGAILRRRRWRAAEAAALERAMSLLDRFDLMHMRNEYAETLSGGQQRLLELARAVMAKPKVLLLDEPFTGVHPNLVNLIAKHIEELPAEGLTVLMVEHSMALVERLCNPVVVMALGTVLATGTMAEIRDNRLVVEAYLSS